MDFNSSNIVEITPNEFEKSNNHSKSLYRSICVPSTTQAYSLCVEYMKKWFLSKFNKNIFKSVYVDGKNIYDDFRSMSKLELLKRPTPALTITPSITWDFNNENVDSYPYGMQLYTPLGKFKESFFSCPETSSYLGIGMETLLMPFTFRIKVETRSYQLDLYKYIKMACRVGFTCGEDVDLDFHIPYELMIQIARDNGFEVITLEKKGTEAYNTEIIKDIPKFLRYLNMHSSLPFLYKFRTLNGRNEFFLRMQNMYVHVRPTDLSADDGNQTGQMTNSFGIELSTEVRFPAPKMYAYYSNNAHNLEKIYTAWYQPNGPISTCYTFKETIIPEENKYGWPLYISTSYEMDENDVMDKKFSIDLSELLEGDIKECIADCLYQGISPSIFCEFIFYNGGNYIKGTINWDTMVFSSDEIVTAIGTYIGIYIDKDYLANYSLTQSGYKDRLKESKREDK